MSNQVAEVSSKYLAEAAEKVVPVGYKQTEVGVIPEDWDCRSLGDLCSLKSGLGITSKNIDDNSEYRCYGGNGLRGYTKQFTHEGEYALIGRQGALCGNIQHVTGKFFASEHALVATPNKGVNSKWLAIYLERMNLNQYSESSAQPGLSAEKLRILNLIAPTSHEQTAIANALSDVDALISELEKLIAKKQAIKTATMQQLLTGRTRLPQFALREDGTLKGTKQSELGQIPEDWVVGYVGDVCDLLTGFPFPSSKYSDSGIRLLRGSNVKRNSTDWSEEITQYWPELTSSIAQYELKIGDIVISMDGSLVGRSFTQLRESDLPAVLLQRVARLRSEVVSQSYLKEWVCSKFFTEHCDSVKTVTAIPHISLQDIRSFKLLLPPSKEEQAAIATILADMDRDIQALEQRLGKTRQIKQGMMQELLTGKTRLIQGSEAR
jgi:type I restriction enzyme S subunit